LRRQIINEASIIPGFGNKADTICNKALEDFAKKAPGASDSTAAFEYDRCLETLEATLDAPLQVLYLRQWGLLRELALQRYRTSSKTSGASEYEAMLQADGIFVRDSEDGRRIVIALNAIGGPSHASPLGRSDRVVGMVGRGIGTNSWFSLFVAKSWMYRTYFWSGELDDTFCCCCCYVAMFFFFPFC
jgi:hypothetical protein